MKHMHPNRDLSMTSNTEWTAQLKRADKDIRILLNAARELRELTWRIDQRYPLLAISVASVGVCIGAKSPRAKIVKLRNDTTQVNIQNELS